MRRWSRSSSLQKRMMLDAEIGGLDISRREPGEARQLLDDGRALLGRQGVTLEEGAHVLAVGKARRRLQRGVEVRLQVGRQPLVIPGRGGVGGHVEDVGQVVAGLKLQRLEVEHDGDEHQPVEIEAVTFDCRWPARAEARVVP